MTVDPSELLDRYAQAVRDVEPTDEDAAALLRGLRRHEKERGRRLRSRLLRLVAWIFRRTRPVLPRWQRALMLNAYLTTQRRRTRQAFLLEHQAFLWKREAMDRLVEKNFRRAVNAGWRARRQAMRRWWGRELVMSRSQVAWVLALAVVSATTATALVVIAESTPDAAPARSSDPKAYSSPDLAGRPRERHRPPARPKLDSHKDQRDLRKWRKAMRKWQEERHRRAGIQTHGTTSSRGGLPADGTEQTSGDRGCSPCASEGG